MNGSQKGHLKSRIYEGAVHHERRLPHAHSFSYRVCQLYLDLDELPTLFDGHWLWSAQGPAIARVERGEHLGPPQMPLQCAVRDCVARDTGVRPRGPIRLLTHARYFGYGFNPVSFYYCFDAADRALEFIVAEVNNTPWGEQHSYVLDCRQRPACAAQDWTFEFDKAFHVSPFMAMRQRYRWCFSSPDEHLRVHMTNLENDEPLFHASMTLRERALDSRGLARVLWRYPLMTTQVITAIHWQALRLWMKGVPVHDHPKPLATHEAQR